MELIRTTVKGNKEPDFKEVFWLDSKDEILKHYKNGKWVPVIAVDPNAVRADNEDTISVKNDDGINILKLADKKYLPEKYSGLGRVYLRKNMVKGRNTLIQKMVNTPNTIYHVQYDYDLNNEKITIPEGCVLQFDGGSLNNGTVNLNTCIISNPLDNTIFYNINIDNPNKDQEASLRWFMQGFNIDSNVIQNIIKNFRHIFIPEGTWYVSSTIIVNTTDNVVSIRGNSIDGTLIIANSCTCFDVKKGIAITDMSIHGKNAIGEYNGELQKYENGFYGINARSSIRFINIDVSSFMIGINLDEGVIVDGLFSFVRCAYNGNVGIYLGANIQNQKNSILFDRIYMNSNGKTGGVDSFNQTTGLNSGFGLWINGGYKVTITNSIFEYNGSIGLYITNDLDHTIRGLVIIGNYYENNKYIQCLVNLGTLGSSHFREVVIQSNFYVSARTDSSIRYKNGDIYFNTLQFLKNDAICTIDRMNYPQFSTYNSFPCKFLDELNNVLYEIKPNASIINNNGIFVFRATLQQKSTSGSFGYFDKGIWEIVIEVDGEGLKENIKTITTTNVNNIPIYSTLPINQQSKNTYRIQFVADKENNNYVTFDIGYQEGTFGGEDYFYYRIIDIRKKKDFYEDGIERIENFDQYFQFGDVIYNLTQKKLQWWNGTNWVDNKDNIVDKNYSASNWQVIE